MRNILRFLDSPKLYKKTEQRGPFKTIWSVGKSASTTSAKIVLTVPILTIIVMACMFFFPKEFASFDTELKPYSNVMPFLSLVFACLALIVAVFAYRSSILRPRLLLQVTPLQQVSYEACLPVDSNNIVSLSRPLTQWSIRLYNEGEASAKYPMVRMVFRLGNDQGRYFKEDAFGEWKPLFHAHGRGYYGFQWTPDSSVIIYPGFSISLPKIYFSGKTFETDFTVRFTYVADGASPTTLEIPVKLMKKQTKPLATTIV